ncbi:hypothetical protein [Mesorhizobium sp. WSM2561]|uniref:hypothetical protein n=1 Tax=Mesorhizobium sp. WSM2561 TaxID=1040985 RepID=UPI00048085E1|nr:hypothetical protein [Mesorhizobium sp. WSM2561]
MKSTDLQRRARTLQALLDLREADWRRLDARHEAVLAELARLLKRGQPDRALQVIEGVLGEWGSA